MQLAAQRGMNAIRPHQDVAVHPMRGPVRPPPKYGGGATCVLLGGFQHHARDDGPLAQPFAHGLRQHHLEFSAMHGKLRQGIARL
ncbi:hypothetical protein D3C86_758620 [compost metagenome]